LIACDDGIDCFSCPAVVFLPRRALMVRRGGYDAPTRGVGGLSNADFLAMGRLGCRHFHGIIGWACGKVGLFFGFCLVPYSQCSQVELCTLAGLFLSGTECTFFSTPLIIHLVWLWGDWRMEILYIMTERVVSPHVNTLVLGC
jgi:hypothetical protein